MWNPPNQKDLFILEEMIPLDFTTKIIHVIWLRALYLLFNFILLNRVGRDKSSQRNLATTFSTISVAVCGPDHSGVTGAWLDGAVGHCGHIWWYSVIHAPDSRHVLQPFESSTGHNSASWSNCTIKPSEANHSIILSHGNKSNEWKWRTQSI